MFRCTQVIDHGHVVESVFENPSPPADGDLGDLWGTLRVYALPDARRYQVGDLYRVDVELAVTSDPLTVPTLPPTLAASGGD